MDGDNPDVSSMRDGIVTIAKEFAGYSTVFTPILLVIALESRWAFKAWMAVQKLPSQVPDPPDGKKWNLQRIGKFCLIFYFGAILGLGLSSRSLPSTRSFNVDYFYLATLAPIFVHCIGKMIKSNMGLSNRIIYRRPNGHLVLQTSDVGSSRLLRVAPYALALVPAVMFFLYESHICAAIVTAAISHTFIAPSIPRFTAGRQMIFLAVFTALYTAFLTTRLFLSGHRFLPDNLPAGVSRDIWRSCILFNGFSNGTAFVFIAACLRFDYANSIPSIALPDPSATLSNDGTLITENGSTKVIVAPPVRKEFNFPKPYFIAAMLGYLVSALILATAVVSSKMEILSVMSGFLLGFVSPAVITMTVGLVAVARKEVKKLWAYREDWYIKPRPEADIKSTSTVYEVKIGDGNGMGGEKRFFVKLSADTLLP